MRNPSATIPKGIGGPPVAGMDPRKGKLMCIKVRMLDDTVAVFHLGHKADGQSLFDEVCRHLNLIESDYFGLEFVDCYGNRCWLDKDKSILRQITTTHSDARFYFIVKFYPPSSTDIEEEYTRYLVSLQIRRDLGRGELLCNENTAALLISYYVQSDCGDFSEIDYPDHSYLSAMSFIPKQTPSFQIKVMENHKSICGMSPSDCDLSILETSRKCEFYGVKLHPARDIESTQVSLSVAHIGVKVYHQIQCISTFSWAKIRKLSFKRKKLLIKLHPENYQFYKETVEFNFDTRNECKTFWKKCIEHHSFFRCAEIAEPKKDSSKLFSRGSSFRYFGRTQRQLIDYVREHRRRKEPFSRAICSGQSKSSLLKSNKDFSYNATQEGALNHNEESDTFVPQIIMRKPQNQNNVNPLQESKSAGKIESSQYCVTQTSKSYNVSQTNETRTKSMYNPKTTDNSDRHCVSDFEGSEIGMPNVIYSKVYSAKNKQTNNNNIDSLNALYATVIPHDTDDVDDNISLSMPNVAKGEKLQLRTHFFASEIPTKSASGENFNEYQVRTNKNNIPKDFDYDSEGSYRLGEDVSSASDLLSNIGSADPRALNTVFTAKRVGDVLVKTVVTANVKKEDIESDESKNKTYGNCVPVIIDGPGIVLNLSESVPSPMTSVNTSHVNSSTFIASKPITVQRPKIISSNFDNQETPKYDIISPESTSISLSSTSTFRTGEKPIVFPKPSVSIPNNNFETCLTTKITTTTAPSTAPQKISGNGGNISIFGLPQTDSISGPLKGKIFHKSNIVISATDPIRYDPSKPELSKKYEIEKKQPPPTLPKPNKPIPPPKPKYLSSNVVESTLNIGSTLPKTSATQERPTMISVENEDTPDVKKIHLLEGDVPYTLTMRHINTNTGTNNSSEFPIPPPQIHMASIKQLVKEQFSDGGFGSRRKSLEYIQRKRLPSQDSFSSQDHSISPTTPESGNILEYLNKKRSISHDRGLVHNKIKREQTESQKFSALLLDTILTAPLDTSLLDEFDTFAKVEALVRSVDKKDNLKRNATKDPSPPFIDDSLTDKEISIVKTSNGVIETDF